MAVVLPKFADEERVKEDIGETNMNQDKTNIIKPFFTSEMR